MQPTVSVILPIYNGRDTIADSLRSLLAQQGADLEFIVINDGSTDRSSEIVASFDDPRIRSFEQGNQGLASTLNTGIALAKGRYIARLDQDDLILPGRLAKQVAYLNAHPAIALLGTWARIYNGDRPTERHHRHPTRADAIRLELLFDNPFVHSSVMMRTQIVRELGGYREAPGRGFPEDYDLWSRIAAGHATANLPDVLTIYREVSSSITKSVPERILSNVVEISTRNLVELFRGDGDPHQLRALARIYHGTGKAEVLNARVAMGVLQTAAERIAGAPAGWSEEFTASYRRISRRLRTRLIQRHLPTGLRPLIRRAARKFRG